MSIFTQECNGIIFEGIKAQPALPEPIKVTNFIGIFRCRFFVDGVCNAGSNIIDGNGRGFEKAYCRGPKVRKIKETV
jgi:hypothetical protein